MGKDVLDETRYDDIIEFIDYVCDVLMVDPPKLEINSSKMQSKAQTMLYSSGNDTIYVKELPPDKYEFCRGVAHELRHKWQIEVNDEYYFGDYKERKDCSDVVEYASQIAEVDANAFSELALKYYFHVVPLWRGVDEKVVKLIKAQIPEVEEEFE